jgi:hypothetical protein
MINIHTDRCQCDKEAIDPPHEPGRCYGIQAYEVTRKGKSLKVCVDCTLSSDKNKTRLEQLPQEAK